MDNSCQLLRTAANRPQIVRKNQNFKEKMRAEGTSVSGAITFRYTNAAGDSTSRTVLLSRAYPISCAEYVLGHCMLRNEDRTFSIGEIAEPRSSPGGEPIHDLRDWLRKATDA